MVINQRSSCYANALILLVTLLTVGCSYFDEEDELGPAPLVEFESERSFNKVWSTSVGDGQGGVYNRLTPVIDDGIIYVASADGDVEAITLDTGKTVWDIELDRSIIGGIGLGNDVLMAGTASGHVVLLKRENGEQLWEADVQGEVLAPPQTNGKLIFVQTYNGQMLALDINDGSRVWSYRNTVPILSLRGTSTPLLMRDSVYGGFANGRVISFDAETGAISWNTKIAVAKGNSEIERIIDVDGAMLLVNNIMYVASYQGNVAAIDIISGRRLWSKESSSYVGLSQGFGNLYVSGEDGSVTAFDKNGDDVRWAQTVLSRRKLTGSAILGSYVIVGDFEGYLHALSQVDGHIAARTQVDDDGMNADLIAIDDLLLVYGNSGKLAAYKLEEKSKGWFF
ncbi:outer membrane protein assembly factor BamB [bacterium AH-315-K03]|nr:outer membrane protein assembly factor BamB [bacterium AH-315-K03]